MIRKILRSPLFQVSSLNAVGVLAKICVGFVSAKVIAVFIGPAGMALMGNLRNFHTAVEGISTLGFQNGIIKYVAEAKSDETVLKKLLSTVFLVLFAVSAVLGALLLALAEYLSIQIFASNPDFALVFRIMAIALPFSAASVFGVSIINGLGKFHGVIWLNMAANAIGLLVSVLLIWNWHTLGALVALVVSPAFGFALNGWYLSKFLKLGRLISFSAFDSRVFANLLSFSAMALFSAIAVPMTLLSIRQHAFDTVGMDAAGNWEAISRISSYSLLFISTLINVYFLPKMVLADKAGLKSVFMSYFRNILPLFGFALFLVYLLRKMMIELLFTEAFLQAEPLFPWQLAGDFMKAASLVLGYCFFAKKWMKAYLATEIFSLAVLYLSSIYFMERFGAVGLSMAYFGTYLVYFLVLLACFRKYLFAKAKP